MTRVFSTASDAPGSCAGAAKPCCWLFSGWNCTPKTCPAATAGHEAAAVGRRRGTSRRVVAAPRGSCARSRSRRRAGCRRTAATSPTAVDLVPADVRDARGRRRSASSRARPRRRPARGPRRRSPSVPDVGQQLHAEADAEERHAAVDAPARRSASSSPRLAQVAHRVGERADAGQHDAVGAVEVAPARRSTNGVARRTPRARAGPSPGCTSRSRRSRPCSQRGRQLGHVVVVDLREVAVARRAPARRGGRVTNRRLFVNRSQTATNSSSVMSISSRISSSGLPR